MRNALTLATIGWLVMAGALVYGFGLGGGWAEVARLVDLPWGVVSLLDVYVGFALFCGWVVFREACPWRSALWVILILTLGNLLACTYVLLTLRSCRGDWPRFWLGRRNVTVD